MEPSIYRFRSAYALLDGYHELENQEIYFAALPELNDPLEGFKDLFWRGDSIVWRNLLRHYLLCLTQSVLSAKDAGPSHILTSETLPVGAIDVDLHPEARGVFDALCGRFFADAELASLPGLLAGRLLPVRRNELLSVLWPAHSRILKLLFSTISPDMPINVIDEILRSGPDRPLRFQESFAAQNKMDGSRSDSADITEQMTYRVTSVIAQTIFLGEYRGALAQHGEAWSAIRASFPEIYLNALERLLYFDWYVACFVADPNQASMWGTYGDSHRGVCLKFKTSPSASGKSSLTLRHVTGLTGTPASSSLTYDFRPLELQEVNYSERYDEIDFFRSLGRLAPPQIAFWFKGTDGAVSATGNELLRGDPAWRQAYWGGFDTLTVTKLKDWQHEREYRLTLHSMIVNLEERSLRKLRYRFGDLQAIIFGIKTPTSEKMAIVRIIEEKCKREGRKNFEIYQTYYSRRTGRLATAPQDYVRFG